MRLMLLCAAALSGMAIADMARLEPGRLALSSAIALLGAGLVWRRRAWRLVALVTLAAGLGGLRASLAASDDTAVAVDPYLGVVVRVRGVVAQPPMVGPASTQLLVDADAIGPAGGAAPPLATARPGVAATRVARVRVVGDAAGLAGLAVGEMVVLEGRLVASDRPGPPTLLFPRLLEGARASADQRSGPLALLGGVRATAQVAIERALPEPQASLSAGVLLGGAGHLDADFRLQLQRSGLAHMVAIDGFKQVVVAALLGAIAARLLGPRVAALPILAGIAGYTLLTGARPAAVRAGLMVGLATLAGLGGRVADPLISVLVAATLMAAFDPRVLLDVGLQLSLSATLGIVLLWPRLRPRLRGLPRVLVEPAGLSVAVTVATLPVTLSAFQLVSLVSPMAHVLAVPLLPVVLVSTALLVLVAPVPPVAAVVTWLAWLPATLLVEIVRLFGSLPGAALTTGRLPPLGAVCLAVALLAWGLWGLPEAAGVRARLRNAAHTRADLSRGGFSADVPGGAVAPTAQLGLPAACVATCLAGAALVHLVCPDGRLHVETLVQPRGEAVFIRGPTGRTALVVGGRLDGVLLAEQVADRLAVWEHALDAVVQLDSDAQPGLPPVLARYAAGRRLDAAADARLDLGGGAVLDVYAANVPRQPVAAVSISYGRIWLPLSGRPPPPAYVESVQANPAPGANLVSDGRDVWRTVAEANSQGPEPAPVQ